MNQGGTESTENLVGITHSQLRVLRASLVNSLARAGVGAGGGVMNHENTYNTEMYCNETTGAIIGAAIEVHRELGPGLLESAYQACLARELSLRKISFEQQKPLPVSYKGVAIDCGYRLDFVVEENVVVELKAVEALHDVRDAQLLTCLKLTAHKVGLLINFNVAVLKHGIRRRVL